MSDLSHLLPEAAECLDKPKPERLAFCRADRWVAYPRAKEALEALDDLIVYPRNLRPNNVLIVARAGNGKSSILHRFATRHPTIVTEKGKPVSPVVRIEMPESPTESEVWSLILYALGIGHRELDKAESKKRQAKDALHYANVRVLAIDELNNVTLAGKEGVMILAGIRSLSNELRLAIAAAGTQAAINALNLDPQLKTRFEPIGLPKWKLNRNYLSLLAAYEKLLPLAKPSHLIGRELATCIYKMAGETIGQNVKLLRKAASVAIQQGTECITEELLRALPWKSDSEWTTISAEL